ncbi:MAG: NYN domain-containing protein [Clostridiales bacterium]|nr:NYN domain-containing protein [Clostridiales bacterium]
MREKTEYVLVDGYNVIFTWDHLRKLADSSLEDARLKLLDLLCDYQGYKRNTVIAVFDAHLIKGGTGFAEPYKNIYLVFTREAETADNFIERTAALLAKQDKVRVVTSDHLEQIIILGRGAIRVSASEFLREMDQAKKEARQRMADSKPVKNNPLIDLLDEKTAEQLERMRRDYDV